MPEVRPLGPGDPATVGEHRLIGRLGEGGQGIVYLAESAAGQVAVKILHERHAADEEARERLLREVEATRQVPSFCTARVLDVGLSEDRPYVVSEYIDGESLEQRVKTRGPLDPRSVERLAIGTASALVAIHSAGIVHRDFKPANVLLASDGPRVVDFGIARALDLITSSISVVGTPPYMSPEQFSGDGVGTASDMFSWAGTMIFAATGRTPFGQGAIAAVVNRVLHHEPDLSGLPEGLRPIVARCMAKAPEQRPNARDVLLQLITGRPADGPASVSEGELLETATARVRGVTPPTPFPPGDAAGSPGPDAPAAAGADGAGRPWSHGAPAGTPPAPAFPPPAPAPGAWPVPPGAQPVPGQGPVPAGALGVPGGPGGQPGAPPYPGHAPGAPVPDTGPSAFAGPATAPAGPSRRRFLIAAGLVLAPVAGAGATALGYRVLNPDGTTPTASPSPSAALSGGPSSASTPKGSPTASAGGDSGSSGVTSLGDGTGDPSGPADPTGTPGPSASGGSSGAIALNGPTVLRHGDVVMRMALSPDGRTLVTGAWDGEISVWDVATGVLTARFTDRKGYIDGLAISPDGRLLISVGGVRDTDAKVWDLARRKTTGKKVIGAVFAEFSPDGEKFVTGSGFEWARLWRTSDRGQIGDAMRHGIVAKSAAFSPDGRVLAIASWDNTIRLWNPSNAAAIGTLSGHKKEVNAVAFLSPRLLASGGYDEVVRFWDLTTRKATGSPLNGPTSFISSVAHTSQGDILACGEDDGRVWLWNATTRRRLGEPLETSGQVKQVLFTPDGRTLVIATGAEVQMWAITRG